MTPCKSCSMPIESGDYCHHCTDEEGNLLSFEDTLARFVQFARRKDPSLGEDEARERTLAFMAEQPAWRDHPSLRS